MVVETFLVELNEDSSSRDVDHVVSAMKKLDESVSIVARRGNVLLATFTPLLIKQVRDLQSVKLVGCVSNNQHKRHKHGTAGSWREDNSKRT